jgi:cell division protein FtsZ
MSSKTEFDSISFDLPKNQSNVIKVIGIGGGGSNAINHMFRQGINGVDFVICNTDAQALENSPVPKRIQLGVSLTEGLGAGANPHIGEQAAVESIEEIKTMLTTNTKMIFITAGMGGGTGTGAAPIIAKMAKELDILTVGIVTIPFQFEGKMRNDQAQIGIENLRQHVDSLIVINNNKLREVYGNLGFKAGFSKADEVLATAARGIAEVITHHYTQNIDLRDAKTVLANSGTAIMGSASASGSNRAHEAIAKALDSPLLNDNKIKGATNVLLLIVSGSEEITIDEIGEISDYIQAEAGNVANIIMGVGEDESIESAISITVIATGFNAEQQNDIANTEAKKIIHTLEDEQKAEQILSTGPTSDPIDFPAAETFEKSGMDGSADDIIKHTLFDEEELNLELPFDGYIDTSEKIKNMEVSYEEISIHHIAEFEQIDINDIDVNEFVIVNSDVDDFDDDDDEIDDVDINEEFVEVDRRPAKEEQMLMFDMPTSSVAQETNEPDELEPMRSIDLKSGSITKNVEEIEVNDPIEVVPITEVTEAGIKRYSLDDYQEMEELLDDAKPVAEAETDKEIVFEKRTVKALEKKKTKDKNEPADPINSPISKLLSERTEERKRKMKEFNYKFRNSASQIDEIEKEPAYKRAGIELDETIVTDSKISRTSINIDDDNDIELRSNNSFLHDNVD